MAVAGQLIAGKYRLEHQLGAGGMGSVWLATHLELGSKVAVKFQLDHRAESPEAVARFRREARAAAQLRSAHVVHIYDYGLDAGVPYIAMEFLAGESLRARLERDLRLAPSSVARIVLEVAAGLDVAHQAGVIHRDIKPANLFIARDGREEVVKLLDFGIAKWADPHQADELADTTTAALVGSAAYMSPEQARGLPLDHRTDLWSLAAVSYEMLTGKAPFAAPSVLATLRKLELGVFESPSSLLGTPAHVLDQVFTRALAPQIDDRFGSGGEFAQALAQAITRFTELGGEPSLPGRARVLGRADSTATMRSAVVSCPPDGKRAPTARALLLGAGTLGVVSVIAWTLSIKPPTPSTSMTRTPASLVSASAGTVQQPVSHASVPALDDAATPRLGRNPWSPAAPSSAAAVASSAVPLIPAASQRIPALSGADSAKPSRGNVPAVPPAKATVGSKPGSKTGPLLKDL